ncbi:MAG: hypothetical protein HOW97_17560 [Catenulispora sp.]|nr:hypothetical protein [Catenulispora sp.]
MLGALLAVPYTPPPCRIDCKPSPDSSPAPGWALVVCGALAFVGAIVLLLLTSSRPDPEPDPDAVPDPEPTPEMDAAQREDLEQRAQRNQAAEQKRRDDQTQVALGGGLAIAGIAAVVLGVVLIKGATADIDSSMKDLRQDASLVASLAVDGPSGCRMADDSSPGGDRAAAARCGTSPRTYARTGFFEGVGLVPVKLVFSPGFAADGEVTVHDTLNDRSLCVRIPDTDVVAAAHPETLRAPYVVYGTDFDVDPYISSGACPDAPVTADAR